MGARLSEKSLRANTIADASGRTKRCSKCGLPFPLSQFYLDCTRSRTGRKSWCSSCCKAADIARRRRQGAKPQENKEPSAFCGLCFDMAHRVEGATCKRCGLEYREETIEAPSIWGSCCLAEAIG